MTEPDDDEALPVAELAHEPGAPRRSVHTWWFVIAAAVVVVAGLTVGILVFNAASPRVDVGSRTAAGAARAYVLAVNDGDGDGAAAISCPSFADDARAAARSGKQGFRFAIQRVRARAGDTAVATVQVTVHVAGQSQSEDVRINVFRDAGRWRMCGLAD